MNQKSPHVEHTVILPIIVLGISAYFYRSLFNTIEILILIDWLFTVLRPTQEIFTCMKTSPLPVKRCKIEAYAWRSGPLSGEGSLSCHICCVFSYLIGGPPLSVPSHDTQGDIEDLFKEYSDSNFLAD
jgi:hypothetical protein